MRKIFLSDNADEVVEKTYMKPYSAAELQGKKEDLANVSIKISDIEAKKKAAMEVFKGDLKPLHEEKNILVGNIKAKAELRTAEALLENERKTHEKALEEIKNSQEKAIEAARTALALENEKHVEEVVTKYIKFFEA